MLTGGMLLWSVTKKKGGNKGLDESLVDVLAQFCELAQQEKLEWLASWSVQGRERIFSVVRLF